MAGGEAGAQLRRRGLAALDPAAAVAALQRALDRDEGHLVVADVDWARFTPIYALARPRPLLRDLPEAVRALVGDQGGDGPGGPDPAPLAARLAGLGPAERSRILLGLVREQAALVLGHDGPAAVDPRRAFKDLGFDSVTAVDLRNRLATAAGLRLAATAVFDHATPRALAEHLGAELGATPGGGAEPHAADLPAALDRLDALAARLSPAEIDRSRIVPRLESLLARLGAQAGGGAADLAGLLDGASAQDVFALLDLELGSAAGPDARESDVRGSDARGSDV
jgi:hypothetical protein